MGPRRAGLAAAGALLMVAPLATTVRPAAGEGRFSGTFAAVASADSVRVTLVEPGVTLTKTLIDLGGPTAQAAVNSLGESRAYASFPYPGDTAVAAPGLLRGAGNIPAPDYPLYVASDNPAIPKQEAGDGPYALRAESSDAVSKASANLGVRIEGLGDLGLSRSESSAVSAAEAVTAHARTETSAFSIGPLRIGHIVSVADTVLGQDGLLTRQADTSVVGAMVGSAPVEITPGGVRVAGAAGPATDMGAVNKALSGAGITVELLPKGETPSGVTAPALRITSQDKSGTAVTYVLGRASASVEGTAAPAATDDSGATAGPATGTEPSPSEGPAPSEAAAAPEESNAAATTAPPEPAGETAFVGGESGGGGEVASLYGTGESAAGPAAPATAGGRNETAAAAPSATTVRRRAPAAPRGADSRVAILATRALLNGGDTRSLYAAALVGVGLCLALAAALHLLARRARTGER